MENGFKEINYKSADDLWDALSPTKELLNTAKKLIYRGQADASWSLLPSIFRKDNKYAKAIWKERDVCARKQIVAELTLLIKIAEFCDQAGVRIPNDSIDFRKNVLTLNAKDNFYKNPKLWPDERLLELMALAQHHYVPTRLLDWTRQPYIAAYFASSTCLQSYDKISKDKSDQSLAIWALDIERINLFKTVKILNVPHSISSNLSAQCGLFTVHPHAGERSTKFEINGLESEFVGKHDTPLIKMTIPVKECLRLYSLCSKVGLTAATIYPNADGAGKAVIDHLSSIDVENLIVG